MCDKFVSAAVRAVEGSFFHFLRGGIFSSDTYNDVVRDAVSLEVYERPTISFSARGKSERERECRTVGLLILCSPNFGNYNLLSSRKFSTENISL